MENKWFAINLSEANEFGKKLGNEVIIKVKVPLNRLDGVQYRQNLDNIGTSFNLELDFLNKNAEIQQNIVPIKK